MPNDIFSVSLCSDCDVAQPSELALDKKLAADLFERSLSLVAPKATAAGVTQVWKTEENGGNQVIYPFNDFF